MSFFDKLSFGRRRSNPIKVHEQPPATHQATTSWPFAGLAIVARALEKSLTLLRQQRYDEAEILLQEAIQHDPVDQGVLIALGHVSTGLRKWSEAEQRWKAVISLNPTIHYAHGYHAMAIEMQGRCEEATSLYLDLLVRFPTDLGPPSRLAYMLEAMTPADQAACIVRVDEALSRLRLADPGSVVALTSHARVAKARGDWQGVCQRLQLALQLAANDEQIGSELKEALGHCS